MQNRADKQPPGYRNKLLKAFTQIYHKHNDIMQNMTECLPVPDPSREEILFTEYSMEKKGKNLGTTELRRVRIQNNKLIQCGEKQDKELPTPNHASKEAYGSSSKQDWKQKQYKYRVCLQFSQRTPVCIYTKTQQQQQQLWAYFHSRSHPQYRETLRTCSTRLHKQKIVSRFMSRLLNIRMSKTYNTETIEKRKMSILQTIKLKYSHKQTIRNFIYLWQEESMRVRAPVSNAHKVECIMNVKDIVSELGFIIDEVATSPNSGVEEGDVKLWVGQITHQKAIKFNRQNIRIQQYPNLTSPIPQGQESQHRKYMQVQLCHKFVIKNGQIKLRNQSPPLSIWTILQFQVETRDQNKIGRVWRSDKFYVLDLVKSFSKGVFKTVILHSSGSVLQLSLTATSAKTPILPVSIPPQHQSFPSSYTYNINPSIYPSLNSIIPQIIVQKYIKSINSETLQLQYTIAYQEYIQNYNTESLSFGGLSRLADVVGVQGIIDKFMIMDMYKGLDKYRGTAIYQILIKKAQKFSFYDAEKYVWRHPNTQLGRLLSAIKIFDQSPRINLTEPFQSLCLQILNMSHKETTLKIKSNSFQFLTSVGRQSYTFFIILGIIKNSTSLLLYHNTSYGRMTIAANTLLFHYVLKKFAAELYFRIISLSINIQAAFGQQLVGLFSGLFSLENGHAENCGCSDQTFLYILTSYLMQRKQQQSQEQHKLRGNHYLSLISSFLSILQLFQLHIALTSAPNSTSSAYENPKNYLYQLNHFVCLTLQKYHMEFIMLQKKYYNICQSVLQSDDAYKQLHENIVKFSQKHFTDGSGNVNTMTLGELMEQLYVEFCGYKHKNQADIRKISIIIDHLQLGEQLPISSKPNKNTYQPASLTIQLSQAGLKLYEHQYVLPTQPSAFPTPLSFPSMHHAIQQKLNRLSPLTLSFIYTASQVCHTYSTTIDPQSIPSNIYMQVVRQLQGNPWQVHADRYALMQIYVKDSVDADGLENYVPDGYVNGLLLSRTLNDKQNSQYKRDIIFANHYFRSFRLPQSNFNLLYAKLGWYGNHYIVPNSRLQSVNLNSQPRSASGPENLTLVKNSIYPQYHASQLTLGDIDRINEIIFYTRCVYGRGIVPSIAYNGCNLNMVVEAIRDNKLVKQTKNMRNVGIEGQFNCCANLMSYLLDNFTMSDIGHADGAQHFLNFYLKATNHLPLLRYLTFRPLQFYLLQELTFNLKVISPLISPQTKDLMNYRSTPHQSTSLGLIPTKLSKEKALPKPMSQEHVISQSFKVVFTNHPISPSQKVNQNRANRFLSSSELLPNSIYNNYEVSGQNTANIHDTKMLYNKLLQGIQLPLVMYFTIPTGILYQPSGQLDGTTISGNIPITVDQLMYLLQLNIMHYYVLNGHKPQPHFDKNKDKNKIKDKQKNTNTLQSQVIGCVFKPKFPNTSLDKLYLTLYQTKQQLQIVVHPLMPVHSSSTKLSSSSQLSPSHSPIVLNSLHRHYTSYAFMYSVWRQVCILCRVVTPSFQYFYVEEMETRKHRLIKSSDMVIGMESKRYMSQLLVFKFTDQQVLTAKDCVRKQLIRVI